MTKTHETPTHVYFLAPFKGQPVHFMLDKATGEVLLDLDSVAGCLGYESAEAMMSDDQVLDSMNEYKERSSESPLRKK